MLLSVDAVTAGYGEADVLRGISIAVAAGESVGLFGPNGHGKTTLLRTISGLLAPRSGSISFGDREIGGRSARSIVEAGLIHVPQGNLLFPRMTVEETLALAPYTKRARASRAANLERAFVLFPRLAERRNQLVKTLSGGERQMLAIAVGLLGDPRLLMLDEPTLGLAPRVKEELAAAISRMRDGSLSLVIVDQDIELLIGLTERLYLVQQGEVVLESNSASALNDQEVVEMYFGAAHR